MQLHAMWRSQFQRRCAISGCVALCYQHQRSSLTRLRRACPRHMPACGFFFCFDSWNVAALSTADASLRLLLRDIPSCLNGVAGRPAAGVQGGRQAPQGVLWGQLWRTTLLLLILRLQQKAMPLAPYSCGYPALGMIPQGAC